MSILSTIFGREKQEELMDVELGLLKRAKDGWETKATVWGYQGVDVYLDAGSEGPTAAQREFFKLISNNHLPLQIQTNTEKAIIEKAMETTSVRPIELQLTTIYIPDIQPSVMWRIWYDVKNEDQYWYGAEIVDWEIITPFIED